MIYGDYNGSAPLSRQVREHLLRRLQEGPFANPNAAHSLGQKVFMDMENARSICAQSLGALPKNIIFNSGATEGISQIFYSVTSKAREQGKNLLVISGIEHPAVTKTAYHYQNREHFEVVVLPTFSTGLVDIKALEEILQNSSASVAMVAVMAANNETGVIQPYEEIARICGKYGVPYFSDTTQLIGKKKFNFRESGIDYGVVSGHKIGALTGTGFVLAKERKTLLPIIIGGGQEGDLRGGTQNYLGYETLGVALRNLDDCLKKVALLGKKRDEFEERLKNRFPELTILGEEALRVGTTSYLSHPRFSGRTVQRELEKSEIFVTTSSACCDTHTGISKVLTAMKIEEKIAQGVIRIGLGPSTPLQWYDRIYDAMEKVYGKGPDSRPPL